MTEFEQEELNKIRQQALDALHMVREGRNDELSAEFQIPQQPLLDLVNAASDADLEKYAEVFVFLRTWRLAPGRPTLRFPLRLAIVIGKEMTKEDLIATLSITQLLQSNTERNVEADGAKLFFQRGQKEFAQERFSTAINYFRRAVEIWPKYREAWYALGGTCELLGRTSEADEAFAKAAELV